MVWQGYIYPDSGQGQNFYYYLWLQKLQPAPMFDSMWVSLGGGPMVSSTISLSSEPRKQMESIITLEPSKFLVKHSTQPSSILLSPSNEMTCSAQAEKVASASR